MRCGVMVSSPHPLTMRSEVDSSYENRRSFHGQVQKLLNEELHALKEISHCCRRWKPFDSSYENGRAFHGKVQALCIKRDLSMGNHKT